MPSFEINIDTKNILLLTSNLRFEELIPNNPKYVEINLCRDPIKKVVVEKFIDQQTYGENKTNYLHAFIEPKHLWTGESTDSNRGLAEKIRNRGNDGDDCGHIIARVLGGKMVDYNLFPQAKLINRGWKGFGGWWKIGVELLMFLWLNNPLVKNPRIKFQVLICYNDLSNQNRPDNGIFKIEFIFDEDNTQNSIENIQYPILVGYLINKIDDIIKNNKSEPDFNKQN